MSKKTNEAIDRLREFIRATGGDDTQQFKDFEFIASSYLKKEKEARDLKKELRKANKELYSIVPQADAYSRIFR